jgi:class 3 adenylate cyclase
MENTRDYSPIPSWNVNADVPAGLPAGTRSFPTGVVTFLMSDIEGSARLWEGDEEAMGVAIARHYELLDTAIALHGGVRPLEQR